MVALFAPDGFARDPNSTGLCPPSFRIKEHDGCQPSNGSKSGSLPAHVNDDVAEQLQKEILSLINDTPPEVQACVWRDRTFPDLIIRGGYGYSFCRQSTDLVTSTVVFAGRRCYPFIDPRLRSQPRWRAANLMLTHHGEKALDESTTRAHATATTRR